MQQNQNTSPAPAPTRRLPMLAFRKSQGGTRNHKHRSPSAFCAAAAGRIRHCWRIACKHFASCLAAQLQAWTAGESCESLLKGLLDLPVALLPASAAPLAIGARQKTPTLPWPLQAGRPASLTRARVVNCDGQRSQQATTSTTLCLCRPCTALPMAAES